MVLDWLFRAIGQKVVNVLPVGVSRFERAAPHDYRRFGDEGYRRNTIIFSCVREIQTSYVEPPLKAYRVIDSEEDQLEELPEDHLLQQVLRHPNDRESQNQFLSKKALFQETSGNAIIHKGRSRSGVCVQLKNLRPDRMKIRPNPGTGKSYIHTIDGVDSAPILEEDIIHIRPVPDPLEDWWGLSPIAVLAALGDLDNNAISYLGSYFKNRGQPAGFLKYTKEKVRRPERERIKSIWRDTYGGSSKWFDVGVLDADVDWVQMGSSIRDLNLESVFDQSETRICMVYQVPPILIQARMGLKEAHYANYREARRSFWEETMPPKFSLDEEVLTRELAAEFGDDLVIRYDFSNVKALQEDIREARKFYLGAWNGGLITRDTALVRIGEEPVGEEKGGDQYKQLKAAPPPAAVKQAIGVELETEAVLLPEQSNGHKPALLTSGVPEDGTITDPKFDWEAEGREGHQVEDAWKELDRIAARHNQSIETAFMEVVDEIQEEATKASVRKQVLAAIKARDIEAVLTAFPAQSLFTQSFAPDYRSTIVTVVTEVGKKATDFLPDSAKGFKFTPTERPVFEWINDRAGERIKGITDATLNGTRNILKTSFERGLPTQASAGRILDEIVEKIGLTDPQTKTLKRFQATLEKRDEKLLSRYRDQLKKKATPPGEIRRLVAERKKRLAATRAQTLKLRADRMKRFRANVIAKTETVHSTSAGQRMIWDQAIDKGFLDPEKWERLWIKTLAVECHLCDALHNTRAEIGGLYFDGSSGPTRHPLCECREELVPKEK